MYMLNGTLISCTISKSRRRISWVFDVIIATSKFVWLINEKQTNKHIPQKKTFIHSVTYKIISKNRSQIRVHPSVIIARIKSHSLIRFYNIRIDIGSYKVLAFPRKKLIYGAGPSFFSYFLPITPINFYHLAKASFQFFHSRLPISCLFDDGYFLKKTFYPNQDEKKNPWNFRFLVSAFAYGFQPQRQRRVVHS